MCGRYVIISTPEAIRALFGYGELPNFPPRYNVAPTQPISIVRLHDGKRSFALMRWGLLPSWVKDPKTFPLLINARGESVLDKAAFRNAMRRRRCLIPADGFLGVAKTGRKRSIPTVAESWMTQCLRSLAFEAHPSPRYGEAFSAHWVKGLRFRGLRGQN